MTKWFLFSIGILLLCVDCGDNAAGSVENIDGGGGEPVDATPDAQVSETCPELSVSPLAIGDFDYILPLGNLNPSSHVFPTDHVYFTLPKDSAGVPERKEVFAPSGGRIREARRMHYITDDGEWDDFSLGIEPCSTQSYLFMHMSEVTDELEASIGSYTDCQSYTTGSWMVEMCRKEVDIAVAAGQQLGAAGGLAEGAHALDFQMMDANVPALDYVDPSRFDSRPNGLDVLHVVCPLDYFEETLKDMLYAELGGPDGPRDEAPRCGEVEQDEAGTAQGNWYYPGADLYPEDNHLALVHDNVSPSRGAFSIGVNVGASTAAYYFEPAMTGTHNLDFDLVTPGETVYCYDDLSTQWKNSAVRFLLKLETDSLLYIEAGLGECGAGPWTLSASAVAFER